MLFTKQLQPVRKLINIKMTDWNNWECASANTFSEMIYACLKWLMLMINNLTFPVKSGAVLEMSHHFSISLFPF